MAVTVDTIREYVRDKAELNVLLDNTEQSPDTLITLVLEMTVQLFNNIQPVSKHTLVGFPNDFLLIIGTLYHLCNSEAERQLRNQINFNAQGLNAGIDDKTQLYQQLAGVYLQQFTQLSQAIKQSANIDDAWGTISSPYDALHTWRFRT